jgi:hypothetical protein
MDKKYGFMELKSNYSVLYIFRCSLLTSLNNQGAVYMSPANLGTKLNTNLLTEIGLAEISLESSRMPG